MKSLKNIARITGLGYLVIFITGFAANFYIMEGLIVKEDAAQTSFNILTNLGQFRWGILIFLTMVIADILLAYTLYRLLKPVNRGQALLSAWLRLVNGSIFALALGKLFDTLQLFSGADYLTNLDPAYMQAQAMLNLESFNYLWEIGLVFFGMHLVIMGFLLIKAEYLPSIIGLLLQFAGLGYLVDSIAQLGMANYDQYQPVFEMIVVIPGVIGEFSLTLYLLIRGVRKKKTVAPRREIKLAA